MTEAPGVVDTSFQRPDYTKLPASVQGVARYLRGTGKALTASEAAQIHAAGRFIVLNDETTGTDALGGAAAGVTAGRAAGAAAQALGIDPSCVIHPSIDFDEMTSQTSTVLAYLKAYHANTGYGAGVYGEADVVDFTFGAGLLTTGFGWQASAWSGGRISSHAAMWQYLNSQPMAGGFVDFNRLINPAGLGAWWPAGLGPQGGGTPITGEGFMAGLTDAQQAQMYDWTATILQSLANNQINVAGTFLPLVKQGITDPAALATAVASQLVIPPVDIDTQALATLLAAQLNAALPPAVAALLGKLLSVPITPAVPTTEA